MVTNLHTNQVFKYSSIQVFKFISLQFNNLTKWLPTNNLKARDPVGSKNLNALDASIVINFY